MVILNHKFTIHLIKMCSQNSSFSILHFSSYLISCLAHIPFNISFWIELKSTQLHTLHTECVYVCVCVYAMAIRIFRIKWMECHYQNYFKWNSFLRLPLQVCIQCCPPYALTENAKIHKWTNKHELRFSFWSVLSFIYSNTLYSFGQFYVQFSYVYVCVCAYTLFLPKAHSPQVWLHFARICGLCITFAKTREKLHSIFLYVWNC